MGWLGMGIWNWQSKFVAFLFVWGSFSCTVAFEPLKLSTRDNHSVCHTMSLVNSMLRLRDSDKCPLLEASPMGYRDYIGVIEGSKLFHLVECQLTILGTCLAMRILVLSIKKVAHFLGQDLKKICFDRRLTWLWLLPSCFLGCCTSFLLCFGMQIMLGQGLSRL